MNILKYVEIITGPVSNEEYLDDAQDLLMDAGEQIIEAGLATNPDTCNDISDDMVRNMFLLMNYHYDSEGDPIADYLQKAYTATALLQYELMRPFNKFSNRMQSKVAGLLFDSEEIDQWYRDMAAA